MPRWSWPCCSTSRSGRSESGGLALDHMLGLYEVTIIAFDRNQATLVRTDIAVAG